MVNPHFDREEIISEDIGFRGPHFNFNESVSPFSSSGPHSQPSQAWSPQGEFGQHGEFSGSRREEVLPSPNMPGSWRGGDEGWGNYPAGEFTGIETISPNIFQGKKPRGGGRGVLQSFPRGITSGNRRGPGPWNDFSVGYDRDYTGPWIDNSYGMMDNDMMDEIMMAELSGKQEDWMDSPIGTPDFYGNFDDYFDAVTMQEDQGSILPWWLGGSSAQEPATQQEVIDKLNQMMQEKNQRLPWPVV
jgi:hypothetical protein